MDFTVVPGARGPAQTFETERVAAQAKKAIAKSHKIEREYDKVAEKLGLPRFPHGELPIGTTIERKK